MTRRQSNFPDHLHLKYSATWLPGPDDQASAGSFSNSCEDQFSGFGKGDLLWALNDPTKEAAQTLFCATGQKNKLLKNQTK